MISNYDKQVDIGRKIFLNYDQEALIQKYTLDADADFLYLTYLGTKCRINRKTGAIDEMIDDIYTECREYTVVMTIYDMLCHGDSLTLENGRWLAILRQPVPAPMPISLLRNMPMHFPERQMR